MLKDFQVMIKILIVTSILMFISIITCHPKIIGFFLLLWVINVFWCLKLTLNFSGYGFGIIESSINIKIDEARENNNHFLKGLYYITIPMMAIGMIMVALIIVTFFTIL